MKRDRKSLLAPFFSSMVILSFKKKGKENDGSDMPSPMSGTSLDGGGLSLGGLTGSLGSLSSIDMGDDDPDMLGSNLLSQSGAAQDDRKLQEMEVSISDMKKQAETSELTTRAIKGDVESIKDEISHMSESIKSLLNIYEAVSRPYNPFVEDMPNLSAPMINEGPAADGQSNGIANPAPISEAVSDMIKKLAQNDPFDDDEPLDRIVRPDDDLTDEHPFTLGTLEEPKMDTRMESIMEPSMLTSIPQSTSGASIIMNSYEDACALEHTRRLIECMMSKICKERSIGKGIDISDAKAFDLWVSEFKRLGGL